MKWDKPGEHSCPPSGAAQNPCSSFKVQTYSKNPCHWSPKNPRPILKKSGKQHCLLKSTKNLRQILLFSLDIIPRICHMLSGSFRMWLPILVYVMRSSFSSFLLVQSPSHHPLGRESYCRQLLPLDVSSSSLDIRNGSDTMGTMG